MVRLEPSESAFVGPYRTLQRYSILMSSPAAQDNRRRMCRSVSKGGVRIEGLGRPEGPDGICGPVFRVLQERNP